MEIRRSCLCDYFLVLLFYITFYVRDNVMLTKYINNNNNNKDLSKGIQSTIVYVCELVQGQGVTQVLRQVLVSWYMIIIIEYRYS